MKKFSPFSSVITANKDIIAGKIRFPKEYLGKELVIEDGKKFTVFRHIVVNKNNHRQEAVVLKVRFRLANMSAGTNRIFSLFPIPFFIGLPGFLEKLWTISEDHKTCQGIYQWESKETAEKYGHSFAMKFMARRSIPGSVAYKIIPNMPINEYFKTLR